MKSELDKIFESFDGNRIFKDKSILQSNYRPEEIPHREEQIKQVASVLAPVLRGEKTSNLFLYGKTGCIAGDSLVCTNNGWKKIKEVDAIKDKVLSFNIELKRYEWSDFIFLRFENKDKLLKITLDNGYELIVTKDHPLLLNNMEWKKSDELNLNDNLVIGYDLPAENKNEIPLAVSRLLGLMVSDGSLNKRQRTVKDSKGYWFNSNRQRCRFFNEEPELLTLFKKDLSGLFKCTPQIIYPKNRCTHVNVISQEVCMTFNRFGIPFGSKSSVVEIPKIILESSPPIQREFLKALFSGDGTVHQQTYQIEYCSNSKWLLQQVSYLLHQEGILCKIREKNAGLKGRTFNSYRLYINGQENLVKFYHKIGFYSKLKQEKLKRMLSKYVKNMGFYDKAYAVSKITKIEEVYEDFVYDLTVPKNHNFIANGIISHNTGKTLSILYMRDQLLKRAKKGGDFNLRIEYLNCKLKKISDTEYRILAEIIKKLGGAVPNTGLPTETVYSKFIEMIDKEKQFLVLILDEIDQAVKKISSDFLYNLTRLNSELSKTQICLVGISNDLTFLEGLDPRVRSSLSEEEVVFPPYNAIQLQEILNKRSGEAFKEKVVQEGVIAKCAALAAREHGDARRALDLLRIAGEIAERDNSKKILMRHLDEANTKIERDKILDVIKTEPKQFQYVLHSIMILSEKSKGNPVFTGDVYNLYEEVCLKNKAEILTQRRVSDIIQEFDMLGIINVRVVSKGRGGRMREIKLAIAKPIVDKAKEIIQETLDYK